MCVVLNRKVEIGEDIGSFGWVYRRENWLIAHDCCREWVASMMNLVRNKQSFYQREPRAIKLQGATTLASLSPPVELSTHLLKTLANCEGKNAI
jgi:hypothetical protein